MATNQRQIYIRLLDEGADVWRPTMAEELGDGLYKILPTPDYNPNDEVWQFPPGLIVRLARKSLSLGNVNIAIQA